MAELHCDGPGPHEPHDGVLGVADNPDVGGRCPLCAAFDAEPPPRPALDPEIQPTSPRDLSAVRERTI